MNKHLCKISLLILVGLILAPQTAFAAWWNPSTWFQKRAQAPVEKSKPPQKQIGTESTVKVIEGKKATTSPVVQTKEKTSKKVQPKPRQIPETPLIFNLSNKEIVSRLKPSVVYVETSKASGSGFAISADGYILTNAHVVEDEDIVKIHTSTGMIFEASVVGRDEVVDLALLKVNDLSTKAALLGDSDKVEQGDDVFTLGFPFGIKGDVSFKEGTISRKLVDGGASYLETSAEIHPGNSGGPLINKRGEVVGINTLSLGSSVKGVAVGETIKLAIPVNVAKNIITDLKGGRNVVLPKQPVKVAQVVLQEPKKCRADISQLRLIQGTYKMYSLYGDVDADLQIDSNSLKTVGLLRNSSPCTAWGIKIKITVSDIRNPSLMQEEEITLQGSKGLGRPFIIKPGGNSEYSTTIKAFDIFVENTYHEDFYDTGIKVSNGKKLKPGVAVHSEVISADWIDCAQPEPYGDTIEGIYAKMVSICK